MAFTREDGILSLSNRNCAIHNNANDMIEADKMPLLPQQSPRSSQAEGDVQPPQPQIPVRTFQGDRVKFTVVKSKIKTGNTPTRRLRIRSKSRGRKEVKTCVETMGIPASVKDNGFCAVTSVPYPLQEKCRLFLDRFPTFCGTYSIRSSICSDVIMNLMQSLGWNRFEEKKSKLRSYHFVWRYGLLKTPSVNYADGDILSCIHGRFGLSSKCGLYKLLWMNETAHTKEEFKMKSFFPKSFLLHPVSTSFQKQIQKPNRIWILKPNINTQGTGIRLYRSTGDFHQFVSLVREHFSSYNASDVLIQRYIEEPLLIDRRKFDLRVFLLIVPNQGKDSVFAFYHPGYVRLTCRMYDPESELLTVHLTNQAMQCTDSRYEKVKEATTWAPGELNSYLNKKCKTLGIAKDWVYSTLHPRMKAILGYIVSHVNKMPIKGKRSFELFGCDFLIDKNFKAWLIEINAGPSLSMQTEVLGKILPGIVEEAVSLSLEVIHRSNISKNVYPLTFQKNFSLIFDGNSSTSVY